MIISVDGDDPAQLIREEGEWGAEGAAKGNSYGCRPSRWHNAMPPLCQAGTSNFETLLCMRNIQCEKFSAIFINFLSSLHEYVDTYRSQQNVTSNPKAHTTKF
ncbi:hypothetical protein E2C01_096793 [Portunus trituberculatus]|uniref:Uncharacterized protein n=1 Tax=Portunus trituberculatus TaxID=210409 RepID=A0A5B7K3U0_PORTR|nr:hypothetical protein [Portunus trituberculatus]